MLTRREALVACAMVGLTLPPLSGAEPGKLPTPEEVLEKHVEALGGRENLAKHKSSISTVKLTINPVGVGGSMTVVQSKPKGYIKGEITGIGTVESGYDGQVAWENNPVTGPRVLEGEEAVMTTFEFRHGPEEYKAAYEKMEVLGEATVDGKPAWKLSLTPKGVTSPIVSYFSKSSGMLLKTEMEMNTPMGRIRMESVPQDYREVEGIMVPHRIVQKMLNIEQVIELQKIEVNPEVPAQRFEPPAEVKKLIEQRKSGNTTPGSTRPEPTK